MVGYIAKLEYDMEKGFYYHLILFFDASERNEHSYIDLAERIGEYWITVITKQQGCYVHLNNQKNYDERLGRRGMGVIHYNHQKSIDYLKSVIGYLCKIDQFIKPKFDYVRRLRRGNHVSAPKAKRGRPRN